MKWFMDNITECKICGSIIKSCDDLNLHLKTTHKLSVKKYITQHSQKYDLLSNEPIEFKSCEQYLTCDFVNKNNYKKWLSQQENSISQEYIKNKLNFYLSIKNLKLAPCQVECGSIKCLLPINLIEKFTGLKFNNICSDLGIKSRYSYDYDVLINLINNKEEINEIIIDTREQRPFEFPELNVINSKLEFGDYSTNNKHLVCVERKSLNDFLGTLSSGYERFEREIQRCKAQNGYLVVVVESNLNNILYGKRRFGSCNGDFIVHKMRSLIRTYDSIQFLFCENREQARLRTLKILSWGDLVKNIDLQYYFDVL